MIRPTLRVALVASALLLAHCRSRETGSTPPPSPRNEHPPVPATADAHAAGDAATAGADNFEPSAAAAEFREAARMLPQGRVGEWVQSGAVTRSTAANLFQIIDGAAVSYERYGVRQYAKTDYRKPGTTLVATIEVYEFANPLGAFGRYSLMVSDGRDPGSLQPQSVNIGAGGYQGTTQITFWKGSSLVQISISDTSDEPNEAALASTARTALPSLAHAVETSVTGQIAPPLSPLSSDGVVWGGVTYLADAVFAAEQTGPAWVGHYASADGKRYRLAIFRRGSVAEAQAVLARFRPMGAHAITGLGDEAFSVTPQGGEIVIARTGNNVFAVTNSSASNQPAPTRDAKIAIVRTALTLPMPNLPPDGAASPQ